MRKLLKSVLVLGLLAALAGPAFAGSPHFVSATGTVSGNQLTVSAKEAGLGDEALINVTISGTALCINNGGSHPKAANKSSPSEGSPVIVQNGKADYTKTLTATFTPDCSPPMTVAWTNVKVTDETNNISCSASDPNGLTGTFDLTCK